MSKSKQVRLAAVMMLGLLMLPARSLAAQVHSKPPAQVEDWSTPVNLSNSGGTGQPNIVIDSDGAAHVIWDDLYAGSVYVRGRDQAWSQPAALDLPFTGREVSLVADASGGIHALWLDEERSLLHQRVEADSFADLESWQPASVLAVEVANFDVAIDSQDRLQAAYVRVGDTSDYPAGIYGMRSSAQGAAWSSPAPIFLSAYFRTLVPPDSGAAPADSGRIDEAHIDLEAAVADGQIWTYVAWDQPALKRVYLAYSSDGMATWSQAQEIDAPEAASPYEQPRKIRVSANGREVVLLWQLGLAGGNCTDYYQVSRDGGGTWQARGGTHAGTDTCSEIVSLTRLTDGKLVVTARGLSQPYLLAWDGQRWSLPQNQTSLGGVLDPATYQFVQLGCLETASSERQLLAVMCDGAGNGDIWFAARNLDTVDEWFAPATGWSSTTALPVGMDAVAALGLNAGAGGEVHALWVQGAAATVGSEAQATLSYGNWQSEQVAGPFAVLTEANGPVSQMTTAMDGAGRLLVLWVVGNATTINFSWAAASQGGSAGGWSEVQELPTPPTAVSSPQIALGGNGELFVLFAAPINEGRGVYLVRSGDRGETWSQPLQVFNGTATGCGYIDTPRLAVTASGRLHTLWSCADSPFTAGEVMLYQASSDDGGLSWTTGEQVAEGPVVWSDLMVVGPQTLHRMWQETSAAGSVTWDALSTDDGETWSRAESIALSIGITGPSASSVDADGGLHLMQYLQSEGERPQFNYWFWDEQGWETREDLLVENAGVDFVPVYDALVDTAGRLVVVYARPSAADATGQGQVDLLYASRPIGSPGGEIPVEAVVTATATNGPGEPTAAAQESASTAAPATEEIDVVVPTLEAGEAVNSQAIVGLILGAVAAAALVGGVALAGVWWGRRRSSGAG